MKITNNQIEIDWLNLPFTSYNINLKRLVQSYHKLGKGLKMRKFYWCEDYASMRTISIL